MVKKTHITGVAVTVVGVLLAGFIMRQFSDVGLIDEARSGFGG